MDKLEESVPKQARKCKCGSLLANYVEGDKCFSCKLAAQQELLERAEAMIKESIEGIDDFWDSSMDYTTRALALLQDLEKGKEAG